LGSFQRWFVGCLAGALGCAAALAQPRDVRVGLYNNEPKIFADGQGQPTGILVELLQEVARLEGWTLRFETCNWTDCLDALKAGRIDLMPDVAYTADRDAQFDFHETPALLSWSQVYRRSDVPIASILHLDGRRVAVLAGSIQFSVFTDLTHSFGVKPELLTVATLQEGFRLVEARQADAVIANQFFGNVQAPRHRLVETTIMFQPSRLFYATAQGRNNELLKAIERHLQAWQNDPASIYFTVLKRWSQISAPQVPPGVWWGLGGLLTLLLLAVSLALLLRRQVALRTQGLLAANEEISRFKAIFDHATFAAWIANPDGTLNYVNARCAKLQGSPRETLLGQRFMRFYAPSYLSEAEAFWRAVRDGRGNEVSELWHVATDGHEFPMLTSGTLLRDAAGQPAQMACTAVDISDRKQAEAQIRHLAFYDALTGLPNRRLLTDHLQHALATGARRGGSGALLFIDLDQFKTINDTLGHDVGDQLLKEVATRIQLQVRVGDTVARLGGDEFIVLIEELSDQPGIAASQAEGVARKIMAALNRPYRLTDNEHLLLLGRHHIVYDGWCRGIIARELSVFYEAFASGRQVSLPDLPIQYADFAHWQRQWSQGEVLEAHLAYWRKQLEDLPTLQLPTDRPRPPVQTSHGARQYFVLSETLSEGLKNLSNGCGVTLFMTLLGAYQTLLHRYTGKDDIVIGTPIAGRNRSELENLIGLFLNVLVLRTDFSGDPTFRALLDRVREVCLEAYAHQDVPFEKLVEELHPERNLSHNPLFQVTFSLQNTPRFPLELAGLTANDLEVDAGIARFDLELFVEEGESGLRGYVNYNTDLFSAATIDRMLGHLQELLEGVVENPGRRLWDLPMLTEPERQQLLVKWNDTQRDHPRDKCIHELFEEQVDRSPDAVAVVFQDKHLTYRELNRRANQLAHHFRKLGVGPEAPVGLCMERSLEMVIGLLGILKAGGAYVPIDPAYPAQRLAFMLEDSRTQVLLTQKHLLERFSEQGTKAVCVDADWRTIGQESKENPDSGVTADNLAYVIYTSGSTGRPKGVQVPHRAVVNLLMISRKVTTDPVQLLAKLSSQSVTVMQATPATWQMLLGAGWEGSRELKILCGGEVLSQELAAQLLSRSSSLWNLYGPTETTIWSAIHRVELGDTRIPIGRPIANTQIYILDSRLQPVPIGVPGELHIGGICLARGYVGHPDLTAEKFIPDPFGVEAGALLYKTGDLARYLPDGDIEFLGRIDDQVKIRGFRIELGEIESVLAQNPALRQVVVVVHQDSPGEKRLVAYVVPHAEQTLTTTDLLSLLKSKLPEYMLPSTFVFLDALPLTPNGKVDRRALPEPGAERAELKEAYVAPRTAVQKKLADIWTEVLKLERLGIHDNFFDIGGHSLKATQVMSRVRAVFEMDVPLRTLFEKPTVEELAVVVTERRAERVAGEEVSSILAEVESLSDEEARRILADQSETRRGRD